jgi:hypothetical protein
MLLIVAAATTLSAQETKAPWWKFGMGNDATAAEPTVTPAPTMTPAPEMITPVEEDSWFAWPSVSEWHLPKFASQSEDIPVDSFASGDSPSANNSATTDARRRSPRTNFGRPVHESRPRNTWAQQTASDGSDGAGPSTWQSMKAGTRNVWHKTVDAVTPGDEVETAVVANKPRSSWWNKMWVSEVVEEGPQTVTEWMAQDRLDP